MATNKQCMSRLQKEYKTLLKEPIPHLTAHPSPASLLEWHFVLEGAQDTDFAGGVYHGKLVFPPQYPFKPPSISLYTPNGRFAVNTKLCLSMTDYHPESWNPMWSVGTILNGLMSFMYDNQPTTGSITTNIEEKHKMAKDSLAFNVKSPMFRSLFPEWVEKHKQQQAADAAAAAEAEAAAKTAAAASAKKAEEPAAGQEGQQPAGQPSATNNSSKSSEMPASRQQQGGAHNAHNKGHSSSFLTVAVVAVVFAIAMVPLLNARGGMAALLGGSS